jgi:Putative transmembrane protein (PGPGW)
MRTRSRMGVEFEAIGRFLLRGTRRVVATLLGFALLCLGLAGLVLPVLPGWLLIFAGLAVLAGEYAWAHDALEVARRKARRSGTTLRSIARRRRPAGMAPAGVFLADNVELLDEVVIDLTHTVEVGGLEVPDAPTRG